MVTIFHFTIYNSVIQPCMTLLCIAEVKRTNLILTGYPLFYRITIKTQEDINL